MKNWVAKLIIAVLFALCVSVAPVRAESGAEAGGAHSEEAALHAPAGHGETAAGHTVSAEGHGEAAGHGEAHGGSSITSEKLQNLFWRTVNFIALLILLMKFLAKPIGSSLAGRQQHIRQELEDLQLKRDEAERSYREFESRLAGMEKEMESIVEKAIAQAGNEKARILEEAQKAAEDVKRQAQAAIQAELVEAKKVLLEEAAERAAALAEELLIKNLTAADQIKITEQYLDRVGAVQ